jgi:hypothetical protein
LTFVSPSTASTFESYYNTLPVAIRNWPNTCGNLKVVLPPDNFKFSLRGQKRVVSRPSPLTGVDDLEEWHSIQNIVRDAFGLNADSRLVLSVVDAEGDEILMYVQMLYILLHRDRNSSAEAQVSAGQSS